jgi:hypothetical protein
MGGSALGHLHVGVGSTRLETHAQDHATGPASRVAVACAISPDRPQQRWDRTRTRRALTPNGKHATTRHAERGAVGQEGNSHTMSTATVPGHNGPWSSGKSGAARSARAGQCGRAQATTGHRSPRMTSNRRCGQSGRHSAGPLTGRDGLGRPFPPPPPSDSARARGAAWHDTHSTTSR